VFPISYGVMFEENSYRINVFVVAVRARDHVNG